MSRLGRFFRGVQEGTVVARELTAVLERNGLDPLPAAVVCVGVALRQIEKLGLISVHWERVSRVALGVVRASQSESAESEATA